MHVNLVKENLGKQIVAMRADCFREPSAVFQFLQSGNQLIGIDDLGRVFDVALERNEAQQLLYLT